MSQAVSVSLSGRKARIIDGSGELLPSPQKSEILDCRMIAVDFSQKRGYSIQRLMSLTFEA